MLSFSKDSDSNKGEKYANFDSVVSYLLHSQLRGWEYFKPQIKLNSMSPSEPYLIHVTNETLGRLTGKVLVSTVLDNSSITA